MLMPTEIYNLLIITFLCFALALCQASRADDLSDCKSTLAVCDAAVDLLGKANEDLSKQVAVQDEYIQALKKQIDSSESILPWYGWMLVGAGAGAITIGVLK